MIRVGIIGCGKIAQVRHLPEYAANPEATLYGFFDINAERAAAIAEPYGGKVYESWQQLLADPEIDAVSVLTPNFTHAEITASALRAGKHVLCEKPMATNLADCESMVKAADDSGKVLMIAQNQRFAAAHQKAHELISAGAIGRVLTFQTAFCHSGADNWSVDGKNSWFLDKNRGCFGAMADLGIHKTDLLVYLLDQTIVKAGAIIGTLDKKDADGNPISVDDNAFCTFVMSEGAIGTMKASWTDYGSEDNSTSVFGDKGVIHIYKDPAHSIVIERLGQPNEYIEAGEIQTNENQTASGIIDEFVAAITENRAPKISGYDVLPAMKAIFTCVESDSQGGKLLDVL